MDCATIRYDPDGNLVWVARYDGPDNDHDGAAALAVDGSGNVYVAGHSSGGETAEDYVTIKYCQATRGDTNRDGIIDLGDVILLINYLYKNGPAPCPSEAGNGNCDETIDLGDVVYLINYLFKAGPPPCEPD